MRFGSAERRPGNRPAAASGASTAIIKTPLSDGFAALREGPAAAFRKKAEIKSGTTVRTNGCEANETGQVWCQVQHGREAGYVANSLLVHVEPQQPQLSQKQSQKAATPGDDFSDIEAGSSSKASTGQVYEKPGQAQRIVRTVLASGIGEDVEGASKNAAENALKQVVGTFIDADTQLTIQEGIRSETVSIDSKVREYSQGSIRGFEPVKVTQDGKFVRVDAKVSIRIDDFKAYVKKLGQGEGELGGDLPIAIVENIDKQKNAEEIVYERKATILAGEVSDIGVGQPKMFTESSLSNDRGTLQYVQTRKMNTTATIVIPVSVRLKQNFLGNLVETYRQIASNQEEVAAHPWARNMTYSCQVNNRQRSGFSVGILRNKFWATSKYTEMMNRGQGGDDFFDVYTFDEVRPRQSIMAVNAGGMRTDIPNLRLSFVDKEGEIIKEHRFGENHSSNAKHFVHHDGSDQTPWNLVTSNYQNCYVVAARSDFYLIVEVDAETISRRPKFVVKFDGAKS
ncbi:SH3 domain-containing protein [Microvirga arabica]|uniref:SH3 domain-containing protein n=1 Tax=Microvirga arabica TaxID=1128671 RepID=UPI0019394215|nr:hypothetical protein [Microvirga arabica]MBM1169655.1 hypothetical protein [Microvirga arabica]